MSKRITDEKFINLYIGHDYADVVGLKGGKLRIRVPDEYGDDIAEIRRECNTVVTEHGKDEFSFTRLVGSSTEKMLFRVTAFENTSGHIVFIIRQPNARVMELDEIGFGSDIISLLTRPNLRGVVGFVGEMGSGKTSAAASTVRGRLLALGGIAVAIEDPPETNLDGVHGDGRCLGVEVRSDSGGYKAATKKAMRTGAETIYLGEVRDEEPAAEVVMGGVNGHLIISTWHAKDISDAALRLIALCGSSIKEPEKMLATGLAALIHVRLEEQTVRTPTGPKTIKNLRYDYLEVRGHIEVENLIRSGQYHKIADAVETQRARRRASA